MLCVEGAIFFPTLVLTFLFPTLLAPGALFGAFNFESLISLGSWETFLPVLLLVDGFDVFVLLVVLILFVFGAVDFIFIFQID